MLLDGLGWSHYSVFAPCIMTQTRVLGRSGGGASTTFNHPLGKINAQNSLGNEDYTQRMVEESQHWTLSYVQHTTRGTVGLYDQQERMS